MTEEPTIAELAARLSRVEDELAIQRLLSGYGPAVDSGDSAGAAQLWTEDGVYDIVGLSRSTGHDEIRALFDGAQHQEIIADGAAHLILPAKVWLEHETATAITYSVVVRRSDESWGIYRLSANLWSLVKTDGTWRVASRRTRLLDGAAEARAMLRG